MFGSERLTGALLDRLTHHVHILEMNGESFRLNQSPSGSKLLNYISRFWLRREDSNLSVTFIHATATSLLQVSFGHNADTKKPS